MIWPKLKRQTHKCYSGQVVQHAIATNQKPLKYLIDMGYQAFTQLDVCYPEEKICIWPQLDAIKEISLAYPDAYYVHTRRLSLGISLLSSSLLLS